MTGHEQELPPELAELGQRLRDSKPRLLPGELDRVKANTMRMKGTYMKARLMILTALIVGILAMGTGGALAVNGLSSGSTAAQGEYNPGGGGGVLGVQSCGTGGTGAVQSGSGTGSGGNCAHATRQVEAGGTLPFTGFLAIPVLLVGVGLLGSGVVLRRRLGGERS